ncbi:hypothetical protein [Nocardia nepalensis]|uniref:hypothetical protein n=1 Tax=Nocardia nepalensis TaxID=3375448 RepID=UPI003B672800
MDRIVGTSDVTVVGTSDATVVVTPDATVVVTSAATVVGTPDATGAPVLVTGLEAGVVVDAAVELLTDADPVTVASSWQALAPMTTAASATAEIATLTYDPSYLDGQQDHIARIGEPGTSRYSRERHASVPL